MCKDSPSCLLLHHPLCFLPLSTYLAIIDSPFCEKIGGGGGRSIYTDVNLSSVYQCFDRLRRDSESRLFLLYTYTYEKVICSKLNLFMHTYTCVYLYWYFVEIESSSIHNTYRSLICGKPHKQ